MSFTLENIPTTVNEGRNPSMGYCRVQSNVLYISNQVVQIEKRSVARQIKNLPGGSNSRQSSIPLLTISVILFEGSLPHLSFHWHEQNLRIAYEREINRYDMLWMKSEAKWRSRKFICVILKFPSKFIWKVPMLFAICLHFSLNVGRSFKRHWISSDFTELLLEFYITFPITVDFLPCSTQSLLFNW